jgi:glycosyltransferase involved in cell wall biosynthesis
MRILFVAGEYPPLQGGLGDFTRQLARACAAAGHEPHVLTRRVEGAPERESGDGVLVHRLAAGWGWPSLGLASRFARETQPDTVDLQYQAAAYGMHPAVNLLPAWLARRRVPTTVTFHDLRVPYLFPKAGPLRRQAVLAMARGARASIVTNVEDEIALSQAGVRGVRRVPIGSNIAPAPLGRFDRQAWLRARGVPPEARVVGYFGFLNESKGGEALVRALAGLRTELAGAVLLLIGGRTGASDPTNLAYADRVAALASELGVRDCIHATGFLDDAGVSAAFAACDCVALPYRDGVSFRRGTLMAALAHGCAIVTTAPRVPLPELADGDNVVLAPPDDPQALAGAIARVLGDSALRARLEAGSLRLSRLFGWDHIAAQTIAVLETTRSAG